MLRPRWLRLLEHIGPLILLTTPFAPIVPLVVSGIQLAEQIPGATGAEKKALVQQIVLLGAKGAGLDPQMAASTVGSAIDTVVGVVNIAHRTTDSATAPAPGTP